MTEENQNQPGSKDEGAALLSSEERFRVISELTSDFAYADRVEPDGTIVPEWVSDAVKRVTGYSVGDFSSRGLRSIIHPDDWPVVRQHIKKILSGQADVSESRIVTQSGEVRWLRDYARPMWDEAEGRVVRVYGAAQDITEQKQAQEELRRKQRELTDFIENAALGLHWVGPDGTIIWANQAELDLLGYTREEYIGRNIAEFHADREVIEDILHRLSCKETLHSYEARLKCKDGSTRYVLISSNVLWENDQFIHTRCFTRDITDRKQAEQERELLLAREQAARREAENAQKLSAELLVREQAARNAAEEASRSKDEFLATISHELRTPLNAILGWTGILRRGQVDEDSITRALETIERNAKAQAQLIEDLLDVSRIITGRLRLDVQPVDLAMVIQASIEVVRPAADAKGIRLQVTLDPNAGPVSGDPARLQQIIWNLLSNAVKFTPKGGRVQVRLERVNSHIDVTVSDTGKGISPEFLPYVFDRFRQADSGLTRVQGGLGLGLAIVRHLVELQGGTVEALSSGEGYGATFVVKMPVAISHDTQRFRLDSLKPFERAAITGAGAERPHSLDGFRLLVVDDERDSREVLIAMLNHCGAEVRAVATAAEAFEMLDQWDPDLLVSDIEMPNEDGYSLIRRIRASAEQLGRIPALALTAHARAEDRKRALSAGFDAHVVKPVDMDELLMVISSLTRRAARSEEK